MVTVARCVPRSARPRARAAGMRRRPGGSRAGGQSGGVAVRGARIVSNPYDKRVVQSDDQGCFRLTAVCSPRPGTVPLLVSAAGYTDLEGTVDAPGERQVKVVMHPNGTAGNGQITPDSSPGVCAPKPH